MTYFLKLLVIVQKSLTFFRRYSVAIFTLACGSIVGQSLSVDSLKELVTDMPEDTSLVILYNALSSELAKEDPAQSTEYGIRAKELSQKLKYQTGLGYAFKNIGIGYYTVADYPKAIENWLEGLRIFEESNDNLGISYVTNNLGVAYFDQGDNAKAIEYYLKSLHMAELLDDTYRIVTAEINIGTVYGSTPNTYDDALKYYWMALPLSEKIGDNYLTGTCTDNIGDIYLKRGQLDSAQFYLEKSLIANVNTVYLAYSMNLLGEVFERKGNFEEAIIKQKEAYALAKSFDSKHAMAQSLIGLGVSQRSNRDLKESVRSFNDAITIATEIGSKSLLKDAYHGLAIAYNQLGKFKEAFDYQTLFAAIKDTIFNIETDDKIKKMQFTYEIDKKQKEIVLLTKDKQLQELRTKRIQFARNAFLVGFFLLVLIAIIIYRSYKHKAHLNRLLDKQNGEIEKLLLNILPAETARELQKDGYATPRNYKSVSVLFSDFRGFTKIAEGLKPHELIAELNSFFNAFDDIVDKYNLEKIKTIGDAYMCAGGIPVANETHPYRIARAGLAMQDFMQKRNEQRVESGLPRWELRIGIHTGPIVAGVVGRKKYAYDIWGDTVNIASRMESNGEVGKVNISASTYDLIKDRFECTYRGKIEAKNKGFIDMYFLEKEIINVPVDEWSEPAIDHEN